MSEGNDYLFVRMEVDKKGMLGRLARIRKLVEELQMEERELERMVSYEEKRVADPVEESAGEND